MGVGEKVNLRKTTLVGGLLKSQGEFRSIQENDGTRVYCVNLQETLNEN